MPDISAVHAEYCQRGWWGDKTFLDDVERAALSTPDKPALIGHRGGNTAIVTYAKLAQVTDAFAERLTSLGVKRGEVVAVQLPNWWELLPLGLACARVGAI